MTTSKWYLENSHIKSGDSCFSSTKYLTLNMCWKMVTTYIHYRISSENSVAGGGISLTLMTTYTSNTFLLPHLQNNYNFMNNDTKWSHFMTPNFKITIFLFLIPFNKLLTNFLIFKSSKNLYIKLKQYWSAWPPFFYPTKLNIKIC